MMMMMLIMLIMMMITIKWQLQSLSRERGKQADERRRLDGGDSNKHIEQRSHRVGGDAQTHGDA